MKSIANNSNVRGLSPEIQLAWDISDQVYAELGNSVCALTSGTDSKHGEDSKHYFGDAIDLRTYTFEHGYLGAEAQKAKTEIRKRLSKDYDVVLEKDHLHIEYDPHNEAIKAKRKEVYKRTHGL